MSKWLLIILLFFLSIQYLEASTTEDWKCSYDIDGSGYIDNENEIAQCKKITGITCPSGYTFDFTLSQCVKPPSCPDGYQFNTSTGQCVSQRTQPPSCPGGFSLPARSLRHVVLKTSGAVKVKEAMGRVITGMNMAKHLGYITTVPTDWSLWLLTQDGKKLDGVRGVYIERPGTDVMAGLNSEEWSGWGVTGKYESKCSLKTRCKDGEKICFSYSFTRLCCKILMEKKTVSVITGMRYKVVRDCGGKHARGLMEYTTYHNDSYAVVTVPVDRDVDIRSLASAGCDAYVAMSRAMSAIDTLPLHMQNIFKRLISDAMSVIKTGVTLNENDYTIVNPGVPEEIYDTVSPCPAGDLYSSQHNVCIASCSLSNSCNVTTDWLCPIGAINCNSDGTCPLGSQYQCLNNDGVYQCSPNKCVDMSTVEEEEPNESVYEDDGDRDAEGNCLGHIYIFTGKSSKCRPVGLTTVFRNCCSYDDDFIITDYIGPGSKPNILSSVLGTLMAIFHGNCTQGDLETALLNKSGYCHYVGEYCEKKMDVIGCLQKAKMHCCFNSKLARIIQQQGRPQLKSFQPDGAWGDAKNPNCRGLTPEEFQMLDFSKIDLSEYIGDIQKNLQNQLPAATEKVQEYYQNTR